MRNQGKVALSRGKVFLTGQVSDTPEIRATLKGFHIATFSLKSTARRTNRAGMYTDRHKRHWIVAYGDTALIIRNKVRKGSLISLEGEYDLKQWEEQSSGETKYFARLVVDRITFAEPEQLPLQLVA
jgi:single stranded DNA-binding protein